MASSRQRRERLPRVGRAVVGFILVKRSFSAFAPDYVDEAVDDGGANSTSSRRKGRPANPDVDGGIVLLVSVQITAKVGQGTSPNRVDLAISNSDRQVIAGRGYRRSPGPGVGQGFIDLNGVGVRGAVAGDAGDRVDSASNHRSCKRPSCRRHRALLVPGVRCGIEDKQIITRIIEPDLEPSNHVQLAVKANSSGVLTRPRQGCDLVPFVGDRIVRLYSRGWNSRLIEPTDNIDLPEHFGHGNFRPCCRDRNAGLPLPHISREGRGSQLRRARCLWSGRSFAWRCGRRPSRVAAATGRYEQCRRSSRHQEDSARTFNPHVHDATTRDTSPTTCSGSVSGL